MSANPHLRFDANATTEIMRRLIGTDVSVCCLATVAEDGRCASCELTAAEFAPYRCSECDSYVANLTPTTGILAECVRCGARWTELTADSGSALNDGAPADSWNPAKLPSWLSANLLSYVGFEADPLPVTTHAFAQRSTAADLDDWDGLS